MTDDLRIAIDVELPAGSAQFSSLDVDSAVAAGRAARRRRRIAAGGAALSVTAGVAALAVILPLGTSGTTPPAEGNPLGAASQAPVPATPAGPQPPELDPEAKYYWAMELEAEQTEQTRGYTEAFWDYFTNQYPGAELQDMDESGSWREQHPPEEFAWFERGLYTLTQEERDEHGEAVEVEWVLDRTTYSLRHQVQVGQPGEGFADYLSVRFEGRGDEDSISVEVLPAGSYRRDDLGPLHPSKCHPEGKMNYAACEVQDVTGPNGEDLQYVTGMWKDDGTEPVASTYFAVLYRPDGSAVVVSDHVTRLQAGEPAPYLSFEQLAAIAAALPQLPVE
jgi:hypothetical protein